MCPVLVVKLIVSGSVSDVDNGPLLWRSCGFDAVYKCLGLLSYLLVVSTCQWALDNRVTHALFFDTPGTVHKLRDQTKLRAGGINSMISSLVGARLPEVTVRTCADDQRRRFALIYVHWAGTSAANSKLLMS